LKLTVAGSKASQAGRAAPDVWVAVKLRLDGLAKDDANDTVPWPEPVVSAVITAGGGFEVLTNAGVGSGGIGEGVGVGVGGVGVGGIGSAVKVAVQFCAPFIVTDAVADVLLQSPPQDVKVWPLPGVAVSVTGVPVVNRPTQVALHAISAGVELTVPVPAIVITRG